MSSIHLHQAMRGAVSARTLGVLLLSAACFSIGYAQTPGHQLTQAAHQAAVSQDPDVRAAIAKVVDRLGQTRDEQEKLQIIEGLSSIGDLPYREAEVARIHLAVLGQRALMELATNTRESVTVRRAALLGLMRVDARDHIIDQAIELAQASPQVFSDGAEQLKGFQRRRNGAFQDAGEDRPVDPQKEARAREFLKQERVSVTISSLATASREGQVEVVQALLDAGVDPNAQGTAGISMLASAVSSACIDRVPMEQLAGVWQAMQQAGADIHVADAAGGSPLSYAVRNQCPASFVRFILAQGAKADQRGQQGSSPLLHALMTGQTESAQALVQAGARVTQQEIDGVFFEPPEDAALNAVIKSALKDTSR